MRLKYFLFFFLSSSVALAAETTTLHSYKLQDKYFEIDPTVSCQIKRFTMVNTHQEIKNTDPAGTDHFTSMAAVIDTTTPECLRKYGIVQFIQGCVSNQEFDKTTGKLTAKYYGTVRTSREKDIYFDHPVQEVDSLNIDPLYASKSSTDTGERMGWYYISKTPLKLKSNRADILADDYLFQRANSRIFLENADNSHTQVYVTDLPSQAEFYSEAQYNVALISTPSLDFKTCLYELKDIPATGSPASPNTPHAVGGPLICFDWSHKFAFNPKKRNFDEVTTPGTDPFCLSPTPTPSEASLIQAHK